MSAKTVNLPIKFNVLSLRAGHEEYRTRNPWDNHTNTIIINSAFTEIAATQTMKTKQMAELKQ